ncbi:50S ribosomal protein L4 [Candidatus Daviesbacteria bacterium]|nr:50S ribosomal protein L4 [Candidatus Daviesbacteria bacterium]
MATKETKVPQVSKVSKVSRVRATRGTSAFSIPVYSLLGKEAGSLDLPKSVFGAEINKALLTQALRVYLNNQKGHYSNTKTRGEVEGSTRKIYRQKGTGRARHGGVRAPIFVGGGIALGPKSRKVTLDLPKKMKKASLISALSQKLLDKDVYGISGLEKVTGKTSQFAKFIKNIEKKSALIVTDKISDLAARAASNLKSVNLISAGDLNALEVIKAQSLIFTKEAVEALEERVAQVSRVPQVPRGEKTKSGTEPRDTLDTLGTRGTSKKGVK